jgi:hypothetical protein
LRINHRNRSNKKCISKKAFKINFILNGIVSLPTDEVNDFLHQIFVTKIRNSLFLEIDETINETLNITALSNFADLK